MIVSYENHVFSIIFQWLQSLQIYPLCGCKDTTFFSLSKKKFRTVSRKGSPRRASRDCHFFAAGYATHTLVVITDKAHRVPIEFIGGDVHPNGKVVAAEGHVERVVLNVSVGRG